MKKKRSNACTKKKRPILRTKSKSGFYVLNGKDQYLYYNKAWFRGGYHFKDGKTGAAKFTRPEAERVISYLKGNGHLDVRKKVIK